ncbi:MAG TPA: hypothetical protein VN381_15185 [Anaerovoracaceae bacterium]|nr:hypothetical protein [Anaerovoracaceae bacterium]
MNSKRRKVLLVFFTAILAMGIQSIPVVSPFGTDNQVYGDAYVRSSLSGSASAQQGEEKVAITIEVENKDNAAFTFDGAVLEIEKPDNITVSGGTTGTVTLVKGEKTNLIFYLNVGRFADTGTRWLSLTLRNAGVSVHKNLSLGSVRIYQKLGTPQNDGSGQGAAALDIIHFIDPEDGFASGQENVLDLKIQNYGNTVIKNATLNLILPDGLSIYNASNSAALGYISTGSVREVSFPIAVDDDAETKNYEVTVKLTGLDYNNAAVNEEKTFYIPVNGSGVSVKNAEITNISVPDEVFGDEEFTLSFDVVNRNSAGLKDVRINVDVPEGLLNKTRSTFIEPSIPAGSTKSYTVALFAADGAQEKAYTLKISLDSSTSSSENSNSVNQYASVYVSGVSGEKTPQLMVDSYDYGGAFVEAGDAFLLTMGLYNTSGSHTISNIKITLSSEDGAFIPVDSSNSFYIEKLGTKERTTQALILSVKPNAEQKTTPLNVDMSYEDGAGNAFTSKDTISIPIMQETRLDVDDIIAPPGLYAGMQGYLSVQFYNMGKTTLNNLRIVAEGDFDTPESTSYFVGNLESGDSDVYDFSFIPRQGGTMEGKVTFTYEDASGDQQVLERPFSFQIMEEMPAFNEGPPPEDMPAEGGMSKTLKIVLGILVLLIGGGIFAWRKIRKKKMQREMEINE